MAHLHRRQLFSGPLVTLSDVRCREPASPCSGEERARGHQLILIRAGVFVKHTAQASRRTMVAEPMQALLLNRHEPFRVSHPTDRGDDCTVLDFSDQAAVEVLGTLDPAIRDRPDAPFRFGHAPVAPAARLRLHRTRVAARSDDGLALEEGLLSVLARVAGDGYRSHGKSAVPPREETRRVRQELVERTRMALAAAPAEPWTLSRLAREVNSSPFHLTRVFRAATGLPVYRYLLRLRLALALEELEGLRNHAQVAHQGRRIGELVQRGPDPRPGPERRYCTRLAQVPAGMVPVASFPLMAAMVSTFTAEG